MGCKNWRHLAIVIKQSMLHSAMRQAISTVCVRFRCDLFDANLQQTVETAEKYGLNAV